MTANATRKTDRLSERQRYRVAMYASLAVGVAGYLLGLRMDLPVAALAVYWAGFLGFLGVWKGSSVTIYDERHVALERRAAKWTFTIVGSVLILVGPALPAIEAAGVEVPTLAVGALYGFAAMFGVHGVVCVAIRCWR
jgi:uncharacterized membrane protein